jgi:uncharacterized membrane protein
MESIGLWLALLVVGIGLAWNDFTHAGLAFWFVSLLPLSLIALVALYVTMRARSSPGVRSPNTTAA